ncbi:LysR family transcriptional regulator [Rubrivivax sp. JA1026]|uniref:LysR family transcriptional regulator n=1 Tax=Rubrivivax sp. JA1026 TaxID=2710888 RepID=UPI0013E90BA2|nr:LysR family transcriptional regulator [Rubrivivax sp. JA1026]
MPDFDWNDLRAFLAMARTGRLTVAARQLGVDHSTLSRRISGLEAALGTPLFDRRPAGFVPTPEGERLLPDAEAMEATALRLTGRLADAGQQLSGSVRVGSPEGFGTYFFGPRLATLATRHPQLELELVAMPRSFSLSKREADLAITMTRPAQGRVYAHKLVDYALGLYASPQYLQGRRAIRQREDLTSHRWIGYVEELMWTEELDYLPQVQRGLVPQLRISNVISQMMALAGGAGLGVLPHFMARQQPGLVQVLADKVRLVRSYWCVTHEDTHELARVRRVVEFLDEQVAAAGEDFWLD